MGRRDKKIRLDLEVKISDMPVHFSVDVPAGPSTPRRMLPIFRSACGTVTRAVVKRVLESGRTISCQPGCAACCRHLIPISTAEAGRLKEIVDAMPPDIQVKVRERFADAIEKMDTAGLLGPLNNPARPSGAEYRKLALEYLDLAIACPFLDEEACTIYTDRPLVCREYMVVSPPENCDRANDLPVEAVSMPVTPWAALAKLGPGEWIPLPLALETSHAEPREIPGTMIAKKFFENLIGRNLD